MGQRCELWSDNPPLSDARARLRRTIAEVDQATREADAAAAPVYCLDAVGSEAEGLEAELARLRLADEAELGRWLSTGSGDRLRRYAAG
jgi:hypothetical protein